MSDPRLTRLKKTGFDTSASGQTFTPGLGHHARESPVKNTRDNAHHQQRNLTLRARASAVTSGSSGQCAPSLVTLDLTAVGAVPPAVWRRGDARATGRENIQLCT